MIYDDITVLTCNFDNSYVTMRMIESLYYQLDSYIPVVIMDNSIKTPINDVCKQLFTVVDNTNFKFTKNYKHSSKNHCASIDYALKNVIKTKYVMLCDNDILFKYDIINFIALRHDYDIIGEINYTWIMPERILPFCCIIDVEKFKKENINYFDETRCIINLKTDFSYPVKINNNIYTIKLNQLFDTGASFYYDVRYIWNIKNVNLDNYIEHCVSSSHFGKTNESNKFNIKYKYLNIEDFYNKNKGLLYL